MQGISNKIYYNQDISYIRDITHTITHDYCDNRMIVDSRLGSETFLFSFVHTKVIEKYTNASYLFDSSPSLEPLLFIKHASRLINHLLYAESVLKINL